MAKPGRGMVEQSAVVEQGLGPALKEAAFAALITFGLCIPIVAWGTRQDMNNRLVLDPRWDAVAWAVAIVFVGRLLVTLNKQRRAAGGGPLLSMPAAGTAGIAKILPWLAPFAIGFLFAFPSSSSGRSAGSPRSSGSTISASRS